jgi:hypothetical protein
MHLLFPFFIKHDLPSLKCLEEDCLADFLLRRDARMSNPGACSLEFQNVMQILTECLLKWDTKTQSSKGKGILGTVIAFAGADEEQGRKTLHRHWQIWVKEIDQNIRDCLFHKDDKTRLEARNTFLKHIDDVISADYGSGGCGKAGRFATSKKKGGFFRLIWAEIFLHKSLMPMLTAHKLFFFFRQNCRMYLLYLRAIIWVNWRWRNKFRNM